MKRKILQVEFMSKLSGGQAATGVAARIVNTANTLLDSVLPAKPGDPRDTGEISPEIRP